jgi:hypothetical protein
VLASPHFVFKVELDPKPDDPKAVHRINDHELASRLSYFLWSSMPDDRLFTLAGAGKLHNPAVLEVEVRRMLVDPKAQALVENFGGQWLETRRLNIVTPDPNLFPKFDDELRAAMRRETDLFLGEIVREDRPIAEFLTADFTYINSRLAHHYGIKGVAGEEFKRVSLKETPRRGVMTQASVLTVTSNPNRTSPVKRGKWILEVLLGTPPPPPPPNVPLLSESPKAVSQGSLRQRMELHRSNPACASCHSRMDPLGFGMENFDAVGAWREREGKFSIDASGRLPSGESFKTPIELSTIIAAKLPLFRRTLAERLMVYALGRGLEASDTLWVERIADATQADGDRFSRLVVEIVTSDPFQKRRGEGTLP